MRRRKKKGMVIGKRRRMNGKRDEKRERRGEKMEEKIEDRREDNREDKREDMREEKREDVSHTYKRILIMIILYKLTAVHENAFKQLQVLKYCPRDETKQKVRNIWLNYGS